MTYANDINKIMQEYMDTIAEQSREIKELKEQAVTFTNLSDMQTELLHKMDADHVSKAELRAWCEGMKKASDNHVSLSSIVVSAVLAGVLEKFCKGEV